VNRWSRARITRTGKIPRLGRGNSVTRIHPRTAWSWIPVIATTGPRTIATHCTRTSAWTVRSLSSGEACIACSAVQDTSVFCSEEVRPMQVQIFLSLGSPLPALVRVNSYDRETQGRHLLRKAFSSSQKVEFGLWGFP